MTVLANGVNLPINLNSVQVNDTNINTVVANGSTVWKKQMEYRKVVTIIYTTHPNYGKALMLGEIFEYAKLKDPEVVNYQDLEIQFWGAEGGPIMTMKGGEDKGFREPHQSIKVVRGESLGFNRIMVPECGVIGRVGTPDDRSGGGGPGIKYVLYAGYNARASIDVAGGQGAYSGGVTYFIEGGASTMSPQGTVGNTTTGPWPHPNNPPMQTADHNSYLGSIMQSFNTPRTAFVRFIYGWTVMG